MLLKSSTLLGLFAVGGILAFGARRETSHQRSVPARPEVVYAGPVDTATFAGGCFWSIEKLFDNLDGVVSATSGFSGGQARNPSYEEVSSGQTGHRESVMVIYDPAKVTYARLLDVFWHDIDPTTADGQFCDFGSQYRTAIFYRNEAQHLAADQSKQQIDASHRLSRPIVTEILPASAFYPAERYHQDFARKNPDRYEEYRLGCGRDAKLKAVWGDLAYHATR
jgi:peptide-methionine (S)-S-oxide reductase